MKFFLLIVCSFLIFMCVDIYAYSAHHYYISEQVVESVSQTRITVSGKLYAVKPDVTVIKYGTAKKISLNQVRTGDKVTLRIEGSQVTEIRMERR